jgi:hypothetical protein
MGDNTATKATGERDFHGRARKSKRIERDARGYAKDEFEDESIERTVDGRRLHRGGPQADPGRSMRSVP